MSDDLNWWKNAVIYQIYPRSFLDTNGDGIGDLPGITAKLDYIASLGVDGIWISPFFTSPMKDFGYDVANYRDVDPMFGTLADFDALLEKAHALNLKIIIDLVLSHTSDQHPWFSDPSKKDWYVWADAKPDMFDERTPPNNWVSVFGGSAWKWSEQHNQFYLHNFLKEQPDLNFHNPNVQDEALDTMRFWLERGVDGFRLDVVNFYFHDLELRDNPPRPEELGSATQFEGDDPYSAQEHIYDKSRPENLAFLSRIRALMNEYPGSMSVGEIGDDRATEMAARYTSGQDRLHTAYNFSMMGSALSPRIIKDAVLNLSNQPERGHPSWAFSNHDVIRAASRWLKDSDGFNHDPRLSQMLIALLGSLPGTTFLYQGEELGLPEAKLEFDDLQDPWAKQTWPQWQGRDGCRTPLPWNDEIPKKTWLPMAETHLPLSVSTQESNESSTLNFTRKFLNWRKNQTALLGSDIEFQESENHILAFNRVCESQKMECVFNLSSDKQKHNGQELEPYEYKHSAL